MMDCKKALAEADGDAKRAVEILRERGTVMAEKKSGRVAAEGIVAAAWSADAGALIEVNCETDFAAKNQEFVQFVQACANTVLTCNPSNIDALMACNLVAQRGEESCNVQTALKERILVMGENLKISRFTRFDGVTQVYTHGDGRIGVMVEFALKKLERDAAFEEFSKNIAMQIAAYKPQWISKSDVSAGVLEKERQILLAQALNEGKPENIAQKIVEGRMGKYYKENCLLEQEFIKDPELTVSKYITSYAEERTIEIQVARFVRFERGEGLEKG
jgi:elongation factor Ts